MEKVKRDPISKNIQLICRKVTALHMQREYPTDSTREKILSVIPKLEKEEKLEYTTKLLNILETSNSDQEILERAEAIM